MARISYNRGDEILEIVIRDSSGAKIEILRSNISDKKRINSILKRIKDKYGIYFYGEQSILDVNTDFLKF